MKRRFVCTPEDMGQFIDRCSDMAVKWNMTPLVYVHYAADVLARELERLKIPMDECTLEAYEEFLGNNSWFNLHMFAHHSVWQRLDAYTAGHPTMQGKSWDSNAVRWLKVTEDCLWKDVS